MIWGKAFVLVLVPFMALSPYNHAAAGSLDMQLFDHHVVITKGSDSQDSLRIDDREVLKDYYVDFDEMHVVDGIGVAVGTASAGGNACEGSPFVVSFPKGKNPRIDGPLDSCFPVTVKPSDGKLILSTPATPNAPGQKWEWTASAGFKEVQGEAFVADTSKRLGPTERAFRYTSCRVAGLCRGGR
ncbi:hypothetical protein [Rhizobium leguminosarum]|uniref:hypothetical protein n=1 Tax=Rhizobium leguminosarum TaxID=384 RepID=UPI0013EF4EF4|nr:hypothetical protein [Rhizobium leguminosarum]